jgi:hypothetical protein
MIYLSFYNYNGHIFLSSFASRLGFLRFETAPFKLTREFVEVMGGKNSNMFNYFKTLFAGGFLEVRKHHTKLVSLVQMMLPGIYLFFSHISLKTSLLQLNSYAHLFSLCMWCMSNEHIAQM